jgi:hypothetical protein
MATDGEWFDSLWEEYVKEAGATALGKDELKSFSDRSAFSFFEGLNPIWLMSYSEKAALFFIMARIRPQVVIEIGAKYAGSTYLFSQFAKKVYVIDIDPAVSTRCRHLGNVEVLIGDSSKLVAPLIERLNDSGEGWDFALVDGDHSSEGVKNDLNAVLEKRPLRCAWIAMHDSFNPGCRKGIKDANWNNPWVHLVEVDFVPGHLQFRPSLGVQMWGGLSLAEVRPEDRPSREVEIKEDLVLMFDVAYLHSVHRRKRYFVRGVNKLKRMLRFNQ